MKTKILIATIACSIGTGAIAFSEPGNRGGKGGQNRPNTEEMVVELIADYDTSGDNALDTAELASGLQAMHEKRVAAMEERRAQMQEKGFEPRGEGGQRGPRELDHAEVAEKMVENFDGDGDLSLNSEELLQALSKMHNRRGKGGKGERRGPPPAEETDDSI